ncbi:DELLA protein RGL1-like [Coffea arabica]
MKLAKAQLVQLNSKKADVLSSGKGCFKGQCGVSSKVAQDLELALLVQAAAEKVEDEQLVYARKLLNICDVLASKTCNFVQKEVPFCLETQFISSQSILEAVTAAKKVHLMDFEIDNGSQWTLIMEALAVSHECPVEHLKITDIVVSDLKDLKEEFYNSVADEAVAIDLAYRLWSLLAWPNHLEALMAVIKNLKPSFLVLKEVEVYAKALTFLERFNEKLLFISGLIDSTNSCMEKHILYRKLVEEVHW